MYNNKKVLSKNTKGQKIIKYLFAYICKNPKKFIKNQKINKDKFRSVSDFISGMTDRYAINLYNNLKWTFSTFILTKLKITIYLEVLKINNILIFIFSVSHISLLP